MNSLFNQEVKRLYEEAKEVVSTTSMLKANRKGENLEVSWPQAFENHFFSLVNQVSFSLMQQKEDFYGYFLFQMGREIRVDIASPTAVNFKGARYVIYFNPLIFLNLTLEQMQTSIKHEILHIVSNHLVRARGLKGKYSKLAINMAMDVVVNQFLTYLPPYATTIEQVSLHYQLQLKRYETFEYYVSELQKAMNLQEVDDEGEENDAVEGDEVKEEYDPYTTHDLWEQSDQLEEQVEQAFIEKFIQEAQKGNVPSYIEGMIKSLNKSKGELPWNLYLKRLIGKIPSGQKKVVTRRNRRQPERLDLRGELRGHKAKIAVALDISGSISEEEFRQAMKEVLSLVKSYKQEITVIECDNQIRRTYKVNTVQEVKERSGPGGGTKFSPVFEYVNKQGYNILIYFTDGKGEKKLTVLPKNYKVLWVISGSGDTLSLEEPYGAVKKLKPVEIKDVSMEMSDVRSDGYSMNHQEPII